MKKLIIFIFLFFSNILYLACKKEPGPILVEFIVEPSTVTSGENISQTLVVTNMGKKTAKIYREAVWQECISGWQKGEVDTIINLSFSGILIPTVGGGDTDTLFWMYFPAYNEGDSDLVFKCIALIEWDKGISTDTTVYTIKPSYPPGFYFTNKSSK